MSCFTELKIKNLFFFVILFVSFINISFASDYTGRGVPIDTTTALPVSNFSEIIDGVIYSVIPDGSGGWFIGGSFTNVGGESRVAVARLNSDGSLNAGWNANMGAGSIVYSMARGGSGGSRLYLGGSFSTVNATSRNNIAAVTVANGSLESWYLGNGAVGTVYAVCMTFASNVAFGGDFTYEVGANTYINFIQINNTGNIATRLGVTYNPFYGETVRTMTFGYTSDIYIGGDFSSVDYFGPVARNYTVRFAWNAGDGMYQLSNWDPDVNGVVRSIILTVYSWPPDAIIGGDFTMAGGESRNHLARVSYDEGVLVPSWNPNIGGTNPTVFSLTGATLSTSSVMKLYIGGRFETVSGEIRNNLASVDVVTGDVSDWNPYPNDVVRALSLESSSVYAGGEFDSLGIPPTPPVNPNFGSNGQMGDNLYFFANSSPGGSGAPSQPTFSWRDTTGSIDLYANGDNQAPGIFTGDNDDGRWDILGQLGGGNIRFFGEDYTNVYIGNNGIVGFNAFNPDWPNAHQPPTGGLNQGNVTEAIFPLWVDMNIGYTGVSDRRISYKVTADELIVTYSMIPVYAPASFTNNPNRYVTFQVVIEFNNMSPTLNSNIFVSFDDAQSGSMFIDEVNDETLRTHLIGLQSANAPDEYLQYRYFSGTDLVNDGPIFSSPLTIAFGPDEDALPVDLIAFNASVNANDVFLTWTTAWEENNAKFNIQRRYANVDEQWSTVGSVNGSGTVYEERNYTFTDKNLVTGTYEYRLTQVDFDGNSTADFDLNQTVSIGIPTRFELSQNYPNPFNPVTKINFEIPIESHVKLAVYDMTGREVAMLVNNQVTPGYYTTEFNGSNFASGVYFYRLSTGNSVMTKRMVLVK